MGNSISQAEHEAEVARFEQQLAESRAESRRQIESVQQQMLQIQRASEDERKDRKEERVELLRQLDESRKAHENERAESRRHFMEMMQKQQESQSQLLKFMNDLTIEYQQSRHVMVESGKLTKKVEHMEQRMVTKTGLIRELEHRQLTPQASVLGKNGDCKSDQGIPSIDSTPDDPYGSEDEMANSSSAAQWYNTNTWSKDYARERSGPSNPTTLIKTIPPSTNKGDGDAQDTGEAYS